MPAPRYTGGQETQGGQHPKFLKVDTIAGEQTFTPLAAWLFVSRVSTSDATEPYIFFAVILRDELPYVNLRSDVTVLKAIYRGDFPTNREAASALHPTWKLCWAQDPKRRPNMSTILESLESW
ncbi:hypothetical protein FRC00_013761 [Tulasnella sp. 408]|nr:hypothetical protein FRC00_013761 [Tulasnella sp. 408]